MRRDDAHGAFPKLFGCVWQARERFDRAVLLEIPQKLAVDAFEEQPEERCDSISLEIIRLARYFVLIDEAGGGLVRIEQACPVWRPVESVGPSHRPRGGKCAV